MYTCAQLISVADLERAWTAGQAVAAASTITITSTADDDDDDVESESGSDCEGLDAVEEPPLEDALNVSV